MSFSSLRTNVDLTISAANNRIRNAQATNPQSSMMSVSATQPPSVNPSQGSNHHRKSQSLDATSLAGQLSGETSANKSSRGAVAASNVTGGASNARER